MSTSTRGVEFSDGMINFIACIEQMWWETGHIPTDEKIIEMTGITVSSVKNYWKNENVRNALMFRGVDLNPKASGVLTIQQLDLANLLLNRADTRTLREKLKEVNVTSQQYHAWMRQPGFCSYITKRAEELFKSADADAYQALTDAVRDGDMRAIQLFFEMRGIYNPRVQVDVQNIQGVIMQVIEIITRHVTDPVALQAIADDIENLGLLSSTSKVSGPIQTSQRPAAIEAQSSALTL